MQESLSHRISDGTTHVPVALCVKIRSPEALTGSTYDVVLRLIRKGLADARRLKLPVEHSDGQTTLSLEELGEASEQIPFQTVDGRVVNVCGTDWDSATRLCRVPARDSAELARRFEQGERFHQHEAVRLFMKFGQPTNDLDYYDRLTAKLSKKLKQTKISTEHFGKIVLIDVTLDLRTADTVKLQDAVRRAAVRSGTTLAIQILARREPNPQMRYHYSLSITFNQTAARIKPEVVAHFDRVARGEVVLDPILGLPYRRTWPDAQLHAGDIAKSSPDYGSSR